MNDKSKSTLNNSSHILYVHKGSLVRWSKYFARSFARANAIYIITVLPACFIGRPLRAKSRSDATLNNGTMTCFYSSPPYWSDDHHTAPRAKRANFKKTKSTKHSVKWTNERISFWLTLLRASQPPVCQQQRKSARHEEDYLTYTSVIRTAHTNHVASHMHRRRSR